MPKYYSDAVKYRALEMWADGIPLKQVAKGLGVKAGTVRGWRTLGQPMNWDAFREEIRAEAEAAVRRRLLLKRIEVLEVHYKDADRLRLLIMSKTVKAITNKAGEVIKHVANTDLKPRDVRDLCAALGNVVTIQRLALGIPSDYTITGTAGADVDDLAGLGLGPDALKRLGDALAEEMSVPMDLTNVTIDADVRELAGDDGP